MVAGVVLVHKEGEQKGAISSPSAPPSLGRGVLAALEDVKSTLAVAQKWVLKKHEGFDAWRSQQSIPLEAAITASVAALQGGALGGLMGMLNKDLASSFEASSAQRFAMGLDPNAVTPFVPPKGMAGGPGIQARNFAVLTGVNAGISCVLKRVRGVDDVQNSMAAAFGSGFVFSLVSSTGPPTIVGAVGTGAFFALIQGGCHKLGQMMPNQMMPKGNTNEDVYYSKTRSLLTKLGLERYEKNFRQGMLTDVTLPLLTDSALKDARIPPGPRLVILDHIHRDPDLMDGRQERHSSAIEPSKTTRTF